MPGVVLRERSCLVGGSSVVESAISSKSVIASNADILVTIMCWGIIGPREVMMTGQNIKA